MSSIYYIKKNMVICRLAETLYRLGFCRIDYIYDDRLDNAMMVVEEL